MWEAYRCGAAAAMTTARSPTASVPVRCSTASRTPAISASISATSAVITLTAIAPYASYSSRSIAAAGGGSP